MKKCTCKIVYAPEIYMEGETAEIEKCALCNSAPEFLEACKALVESVYKCDAQNGDVVCSVNVIEFMERTIAKAERV